MPETFHSFIGDYLTLIVWADEQMLLSDSRGARDNSDTLTTIRLRP
jgi:hypothetical protein